MNRFLLFFLLAVACNNLFANELDTLKQNLSDLQDKLIRLDENLKNLGTVPAAPLIKKVSGNQYTIGKVTIHFVSQDITTMKVDAIVNAANKTLMKSPGGVARIIWNAAGAKELNQWITNNLAQGKTPGTEIIIQTGEAEWTPSFNLSIIGIKGIIQAVGPDCKSEDNVSLLYNTYKNSLLIANQKGYTSIAFPAISTVIFDCSENECAPLVAQALVDTASKTSLTDIYLTFYPAYGTYPGLIQNALDALVKK